MSKIAETRFEPDWSFLGKPFEACTVQERGDALLARMLAMPPIEQKKFVGKSTLPPKRPDKPKLPPSKGFQIPAGSLLADLHAIVPRMRPEWREELIQDLAVAICAGEVTLDAIRDPKVLGKYRRAVTARPVHERHSHVGLSRKAHRDDNFDIGDSLVGAEDVEITE